MKKNSKNHHAGRIISLLIALCMVLAIVPITAFAANDQEITLVDFGNVWKNLDSTKPVVFTTELNPDTGCPNQMEITDQVWLESESGASISSNAYPEAGKEYLYQITLTAKEGYFFPNRMSSIPGVAFPNFNGTVIIDGVKKISDGVSVNDESYNEELYNSAVTFVYDSGKTLVVMGYPAVIATNGTSQDDYVIHNVVINNAPASCTVGEAPKAMATKGDDEAYTFYEYWEEWAEEKVLVGEDPVKFWYSDAEQMNRVPADKRITTFEEGKSYSYSIIAEANENYTFASQDNLSVTRNGEDYKDKSEVILDGAGLMMGPKFMTPKKPATPKEIELIEINNATLTFKDGDKPVFTGTVPDGAPYVLVFEEWRTDGEWTRSDEWFNDADHHGSDKDITAFDKNKSYNYNLYLKTTAEGSEEGWYFGSNTKLKINGKEVSFTFTNNDPDVFMVTTGITMTPTAAGASDYKIIEGANGAWTQNTDGTLTFRANGDFSKFTGVKVDGTLIDAKNYTAVSGSTVITLKADYLKTLSVGTHKLTVVYTDGECSTNYEIKGTQTENGGGSDPEKAPQTGDNSNIPLWFALMALSVLGLGVAFLYGRKRKVIR